MYKITHDRKKCISCGACATICPEFFEMSDADNVATLKNAKEKNGIYELEVEDPGRVKEIADTCPMGIIKVEKI